MVGAGSPAKLPGEVTPAQPGRRRENSGFAAENGRGPRHTTTTAFVFELRRERGPQPPSNLRRRSLLGQEDSLSGVSCPCPAAEADGLARLMRGDPQLLPTRGCVPLLLPRSEGRGGTIRTPILGCLWRTTRRSVRWRSGENPSERCDGVMKRHQQRICDITSVKRLGSVGLTATNNHTTKISRLSFRTDNY